MIFISLIFFAAVASALFAYLAFTGLALPNGVPFVVLCSAAAVGFGALAVGGFYELRHG